MRKITDYQMIHSSSPTTFSDKVRDAINDGWVPLKNMCIGYSNSVSSHGTNSTHDIFAREMVKYEYELAKFGFKFEKDN
jgi:hypothetical protein